MRRALTLILVVFSLLYPLACITLAVIIHWALIFGLTLVPVLVGVTIMAKTGLNGIREEKKN